MTPPAYTARPNRGPARTRRLPARMRDFHGHALAALPALNAHFPRSRMKRIRFGNGREPALHECHNLALACKRRLRKAARMRCRRLHDSAVVEQDAGLQQQEKTVNSTGIMSAASSVACPDRPRATTGRDFSNDIACERRPRERRTEQGFDDTLRAGGFACADASKQRRIDNSFSEPIRQPFCRTIGEYARRSALPQGETTRCKSHEGNDQQRVFKRSLPRPCRGIPANEDSSECPRAARRLPVTGR